MPCEMPLSFEAFQNPPKQYRPWTVWWWFGSASKAEDLVWELQQMDAHGIGGVEINPVYALNEAGLADPKVFSTEWQERFFAVVREADQLGMKVWLRGGSGWPFGGPWITPELASQSVVHAVAERMGPGEWNEAVPAPVAQQRWKDPQLECVVGLETKTGKRQVLIANAEGRATGETVRFSIPAGAWRLFFVYRMRTNMAVKRPAPGGAGLVMDHYSTKALDAQLAALDPFVAKAKQMAPHAFVGIAEDSLELDDDNWTGGFLDEFQRRRSYDLRPFLPDLWEDSATSSGIRHDFLLTVSDLMIDRHFNHMRAWAGKLGLSTMVEAHGSMTDILRAYAAADVPDGETIWEYKERQEVNIRNRRVASSAAHIYGKPIAAAESYTWLRMPRFLVKPWMVKGATDAMFLDGINQIRNHGYSSSPRDMGAPGQVFYASTMINHNQTWWPHYPAISGYVTRMQYLLQQGKATNRVWIYHNLWDGMDDYRKPTPEWMKSDNAWRRPSDPGIDGSAQIAMRTHDVAETLREQGYGFDYINDHALETQFPDGFHAESLGGVHTLVLARTKFMPTATLRRLLDLVKAGVYVLSLGNLPESGVGYEEQHEGKAAWQAAFDALWKTGKWMVVSDAFAMQLWLRFHPKPDFQADANGKDLGFLRRRIDGQDVYFVSNGSDTAVESVVLLATEAASAERWDALSGTRTSVSTKRSQDHRMELTLQLGPWESCALVLSGAKTAGKPGAQSLSFVKATQQLELTDWEIGREGDDVVIPLPQGPANWENLTGWKNFAGVGSYRASLQVPSDLAQGRRLVLELGNLEVSAQVLVNQKDVGIVILPPWRIDITDAVRSGHNTVEIRVANLWSNAVAAMPAAPSTVPGPGYGITDVLYGPAERPVQQSGLLGPVKVLVTTAF